MHHTIGFIGAGNMGAAMIRGIIKSGFDPSRIYVNSFMTEEFAQLLSETGITHVEDNGELVKKCDIVLLAVKPQNAESVLQCCKADFDEKKILVSIAASLPISFYENILGDDKKIIRAMPNTPAMVLQSMSALAVNARVTDEDCATVKEIFESFGMAEIVSEDKLNVITAIAGSSPAYVFMFIEAMADGAVRMGLDRKTAYRMAAQAVKGSAQMVLETGIHPAQLKDNVCSPGGTTIAAVEALEKNGFRHAVMEAVTTCANRADEMAGIAKR